MRLPNGFGSISKVNKSLRKKYLVRVTTHYEVNEQGKKIQRKKTIGYYSSRKEAMEALTEYNKKKTEGFNELYGNVTFEELWEEWFRSKRTQKLSYNTIKSYRFTHNLISKEIRNKQFSKIKYNDLQRLIDYLASKGKGYQTLRKLKNTLSQLYKYAIKCDIVSKNYAEILDIGKLPKKEQTLIFTDNQIEQLWTMHNENSDITIDVMLMLIYNGCRISELLELKIENMNIEEKYFDVVNSKTNAGIRRVPINEKVLHIYKQLINNRTEGYFLINPYSSKEFKYSNFRHTYWDPLIEYLGWNKDLTPHNCRKTCISLLTRAGVRSLYIKLIIGHESALDLTEKTYTYVDFKQLLDAINEI